VQNRSLAYAIVAFAAFLASAQAQQDQKPGGVRNCEEGGTRRLLTGQAMTDFMKLCQAERVNPENLGKICNDAADSQHLSGTGRQTYLAECTNGPA
jgi:hypothetical protein